MNEKMAPDDAFNEYLKNIADIIGSFGATSKEAAKACRALRSSKNNNELKRKKT
jgi:hypothetical protein